MSDLLLIKTRPENDPKRSVVVVFSVRMFDGKAAAQWRGTDVAPEEIVSFNTPTSICLFSQSSTQQDPP